VAEGWLTWLAVGSRIPGSGAHAVPASNKAVKVMIIKPDRKVLFMMMPPYSRYSTMITIYFNCEIMELLNPCYEMKNKPINLKYVFVRLVNQARQP
jgi:hypothetical protein